MFQFPTICVDNFFKYPDEIVNFANTLEYKPMTKKKYDAFALAKKLKTVIFSTPFSVRAVDFLEKFKVPIYKIASFEITDLKLINYIAKKRKPIIISTGTANQKEIDKAVKTIKK